MVSRQNPRLTLISTLCEFGVYVSTSRVFDGTKNDDADLLDDPYRILWWRVTRRVYKSLKPILYQSIGSGTISESQQNWWEIENNPKPRSLVGFRTKRSNKTSFPTTRINELLPGAQDSKTPS